MDRQRIRQTENVFGTQDETKAHVDTSQWNGFNTATHFNTFSTRSKDTN